MNSAPQFWKIGDLAEKTGLTVRTLHHYEEIGLLAPSHRTTSNHRLYDASDVERLQRIVSLKHLGFSLEQIRECLEKPGYSLSEVLGMQLEKAREQSKRMEELTERLEGLQRFAKSGAPGADDLLKTIDLMNEIESAWTEDEMRTIKAQGEKIGKQAILDAEQEWPRLIAEAQRHMEAGTDPKGPEMRKIAKRWKQLVESFTGGNPQIAAKLKKMYEENPDAMRSFGGPSPELRAYVDKAME